MNYIIIILSIIKFPFIIFQFSRNKKLPVIFLIHKIKLKCFNFFSCLPDWIKLYPLKRGAHRTVNISYGSPQFQRAICSQGRTTPELQLTRGTQENYCTFIWLGAVCFWDVLNAHSISENDSSYLHFYFVLLIRLLTHI